MYTLFTLPSKIECRVPDIKGENWEIETFEVDTNSLQYAIHAINSGGRTCDPGTYKRLMYTGGTWKDTMMSNTPAEIRDHNKFLLAAKGHVLINGLGLGIIIEALLLDSDVTKITVIEKDVEIIKLVAPHFANEEKLEIIHADAFEYQPPKGIKYDCVWHDIWLNITSDNLPEMSKLHRKYGRKTDWQGSWSKKECQRMKREENRYSYGYKF